MAEDGHEYLGFLTVEAQPVNRHNGLTRDLQGRLIAAEHDGRRISRMETTAQPQSTPTGSNVPRSTARTT
ncbi:MAG: hypothetical protein F4X57_13745 [Chloroflexi bacterium]|nr:hypothetical protein [Chloroflexota bacterium]